MTEINDIEMGKIFRELNKAMKKFPTWPSDPLHALAVLGEEFGELTREVLQATYEKEPRPEYFQDQKERIREEAIQTAAMALRFVFSLDKYEYTPREQHEQ